MRNNAASVESADPHHNTIVSIHRYSRYGSPSTMNSYMSTFKSDNLPLIVGGFAPYDAYGNVDEDTIPAAGPLPRPRTRHRRSPSDPRVSRDQTPPGSSPPIVKIPTSPRSCDRFTPATPHRPT